MTLSVHPDLRNRKPSADLVNYRARTKPFLGC